MTNLVNKGQTDSETGAEIVSHVLVQVLVLILISALLQLAFALHTRNTALDAASEAARYLSLENASETQAETRVKELLEKGAGNTPTSISITTETIGELQKITVVITSPLPILGPWGLPETLQVNASAWKIP